MAPGHGDEARQQERCTDSGIEIAPVYGPPTWRAGTRPCSWATRARIPYTRGVHPEHVPRPSSGRCASTPASARPRQTNERFQFLLDAGQTGLSCAFDLPTQMGYDSDHPRAEGEVGKVGVAIDSLADMRLFWPDSRWTRSRRR